MWPSIAYDGKAIVFERDFAIWKVDITTSRVARIDIELRGAPAGPDMTHLSLSTQFRDLAVAMDGKKVAFVAHGDVFAAAAKEGGTAARITSTPANDFAPEWTPNSRRITYVSDRDDVYHLYEYDFGTGSETRLTNDPQGESSPLWSPDGKLLAFARGSRKLMVYDPATKRERQLAEGFFGRPPAGPVMEWSPDSQ